MQHTPLQLQVSQLNVFLKKRKAIRPLVQDISLFIRPRETLALVGESGSGKSVLAQAIMGLFATAGPFIESGTIHFEDKELQKSSFAELQKLWGKEIAFISQNPHACLNPFLRIGTQLLESIDKHTCASWQERQQRAIAVLKQVGIADPEKRLFSYPDELSGGMKQRILLALAIINQPKLLIADEPTTALDVTTQAQILDLLIALQKSLGMSLLFITHDLAIVAKIADRIAVMHAGRIVETGSVEDIFYRPQHPYTEKLLKSIPHWTTKDIQQNHLPSKNITTEPLFELKNVAVAYELQKKRFLALHYLSLKGYPGQTLGVVGESGCGKSTLAKTLLYLIRPDAGEVIFEGVALNGLPRHARRLLRQKFQMIFQDPDTSLDPRMTIYELLAEALSTWNVVHPKEIPTHIDQLLATVHLNSKLATRFPHELSGGEKQRISIARALSVKPRLLICDEALSSLDLSIRAEMIHLFRELQTKYDLAYLFITHDLATLRQLAHTVAVLYLGTLVELAPVSLIYAKPLHPYTQALLASIPIAEPCKARQKKSLPITGEIPSIVSPPSGCVFHTRCPYKQPLCTTCAPPLREINKGQFVACHFAELANFVL
jgi:peptide/nickel transport system ATP-binding protein